jgi:S1-C subfamily serine protease
VLRIRRIASSPIFSGLLGGLVVAIACAGALSAGWIGDEETGPAPVAALSSSDDAPLMDDGLSVNEIYEKAAPGVAHVEAQVGTQTASAPVPGSPPLPGGGGTATGSGFVIDDRGHIVTNAHVVADAERIDVTLGDQAPVEAKLVGSDPSTDLALLEVDPGSVELHPVSLADSSRVRVGDPVVAIGNPFGLDNTATAGIVSALQREIQAPNGFSISDAIQTDAPINPGNSGGPLFDAAGQVIGINSQIATGGSGDGSVGIGFAVPSSTATDVTRQLLETGEVHHAFLGISGADVSPQLADALNLSVDQGALVNEVTKGGPAEAAGVQPGDEQVTVEGRQVLAGGDVITAIDGEPVTGMDDVISVVNSKQAGDEIALELLRDGETVEVTVTLGDRPASAA